MLEAQYANDVLDGEMRCFGPDGAATAVISHKAGARHGEMTVYGPTGAVAQVMTFANGVLHGHFKTYGEAGALISEEMFVAGAPVKTDASGTPANGAATSDEATTLEEEVAGLRSSFYDQLVGNRS
ncbi:MAG: hypothetical protein AAF360_07225 [Pseudomonadota bacterium]